MSDRDGTKVWEDCGVIVMSVDGKGRPGSPVVLDSAGPDDTAVMLYTSGTTGKP